MKPSKQVRQPPKPQPKPQQQPQQRPPTRAEMLQFVLDIGDHMADAGALSDLRPEIRVRYRACVNALRQPDAPHQAATQVPAVKPGAEKPCPDCNKRKTKSKAKG